MLGTHQDLSGPIKSWGVPVTNGMKLAVEEINAAGGINGRKLKLIVEDVGYDPKRAVLASQKLVEKDKIFAMVGPLGSPTVLAAQDILLEAGVPQLFPVTSAEFTYKMDPKNPQERLKFNNVPPYTDSVRAGARHLIQEKGLKKPCVLYQDDEFGKNVLDGFTQALADTKLTAAATTSYKRGASDFSSQVAKLKSDGCDFVVLGTVVRETVGVMAEAKKIGFNPVYFGSTATNVVEVPALGKELTEGFYAVGGMEIPYRDTADGQGQGVGRDLLQDLQHGAQHPVGAGLQRHHDLRPLRQARGQGPDRPEVPGGDGVRGCLPGHVRLAAGEVLADAASVGDGVPAPADQGWPLGCAEARPHELIFALAGDQEGPGGLPSGPFLLPGISRFAVHNLCETALIRPSR